MPSLKSQLSGPQLSKIPCQDKRYIPVGLLGMSQPGSAAGAIRGSSPWEGPTYGLRKEFIAEKKKKKRVSSVTGLRVWVTPASPSGEFGPSALDRAWS